RGILPLLFLILVSTEIHAEFEAGELGGVARLEILPDPFSFGPGLVGELHQESSLSPFQAELLRRLEYGSSGSAFCIFPGLLLTNAHVILAGARYPGLAVSPGEWVALEAEVLAATRPWLSLTAPTGERLRIPAEVVALDIEEDLALIHCYDPTGVLHPLELADPNRLKVGMPVTAAGYSAAGLKVTRGKVESLIRGQKVLEPAKVRSRPGTGHTPLIVGSKDGEIVRLQHSAATESGISGGPLLDERGRVVGVAYGLLRPTHRNEGPAANLQLAIAVGVVKKFLQGRIVEIPPLPTRTQQEAEEGDISPTGSDSFPPSQPAWVGSTEELEKIERMVQNGNAATAIPLLEARLRHNRYDFPARAFLSLAHYEEARFGRGTTVSNSHLLAAFYQSAWLAYFAPELGLGAQAKRFIDGAATRRRLGPHASTSGTKTLLLSLDVQARLQELLSAGRLTEELETARKEMETLTVRCEKARARAAKADVVATAALVDAYLALEQSWEVWPGLPEKESAEQEKRRAGVLRKALRLAQPLAAQLSRSPGAQSLLGLVYARLSRLRGAEDALPKARAAYEHASRLDPDSPSIKEALTALQADSTISR
ncbi:MAG: trypsin-like serine protease, partial [Armatimonadetes bacterium]|nr:trypsin-like serine protease [Armatimonadota bacterium]NIM23112.1 trypsin-like serine protease [Armatimonadota bacterium]NIM66980.1 trypsin-like serine protease [Armatimonadota bacterium]NIM75514.1 trypsin-like serine protease [Armatimonadota bacterium]NIN05169.1 trypsin-like serine protease [Armatimonadota bacterium]